MDLKLRLELAMVGSCNCLTKTHDPKYHNENCKYKAISDGLSEIERLESISDERFSQLLNMDKLIVSVQDDRDMLLNKIKTVQVESDKCGLIGMIGSAAWISQINKLASK
jgi:hypothetical protein